MLNLVFNYMTRKDQLLELSPTKKQAVIKLAAKIFDKILKTPGADVEESYIFTLSCLWIYRKTSVFKDRAEKPQSVFSLFCAMPDLKQLTLVSVYRIIFEDLYYHFRKSPENHPENQSEDLGHKRKRPDFRNCFLRSGLHSFFQKSR